jgi:hypothetical protein
VSMIPATYTTPCSAGVFRVRRLLVAAALLCCWDGVQPRSACENDASLFDRTYPTDLWLDWNSSSGASGRIEYYPSSPGMGAAVQDENGTGGTRRRVVFAPGTSDCLDFPNATTAHRGQQSGVSFRNAFVLFLGMVGKTGLGVSCFWMSGLSKPPVDAGAAGVIHMWSDEQPERDGRIYPTGWDLTKCPFCPKVTTVTPCARTALTAWMCRAPR